MGCEGNGQTDRQENVYTTSCWDPNLLMRVLLLFPF